VRDIVDGKFSRFLHEANLLAFLTSAAAVELAVYTATMGSGVAAAPAASEPGGFLRGGGGARSPAAASAATASRAARGEVAGLSTGRRKRKEREAEQVRRRLGYGDPCRSATVPYELIGPGNQAMIPPLPPSDAKQDDAFLHDAVAQMKSDNYVGMLRPRTINVGARLLGVVVEVGVGHAVAAAPHGLRVRVDAAEATDWLSHPVPEDLAASGVLCIGDPAPLTVVEVEAEGRKRLHGSLRPSRLQAGLDSGAVRPGACFRAAVASREDLGWLLHLGRGLPSAFLPDSAAVTLDGPPAVGRLLDVVVVKAGAKGGRGPATVTVDPAQVNEAKLVDWGGLSLDGLVPGGLVTAKVTRHLDDGLEGTFLGVFTGTVDSLHLGLAPHELTYWKDKLPVGRRVEARVLHVDPSSKAVGLTLRPSLVTGGAGGARALVLPPVGTIFELAVVRRIDPGVGILVELKNHDGTASAAGYAHVSELSDAPGATAGGKGKKGGGDARNFKIGQAVRCRVVGHRPVDGLASLSLRPSVLAQSVLVGSQLVVGAEASGTVREVGETCLWVDLGPGVRARVPDIHMADVGVGRAHRRFKEGQKVHGLVLEATPGRAPVLTLKKGLTRSRLPRLASVNDAVAALAAAVLKGEPVLVHGTVTGWASFGCFVQLWGGLSGLASRTDLGLAEGDRPDMTEWGIGNLVKVRVLSVDRQRSRLRLGSSSGLAASGAAASSADAPQLEIGAIVDAATVISTPVDAAADDAELEVTTPVGQHLKVPVVHLSDHPRTAAALGAALRAGDDLPGPLLVLSPGRPGAAALATRKPALVAAAASLPRDANDLVEGLLFPGYIASVTAGGAFVRFLGRVTARAGRAQLPAPDAPTAADVLRPGQTVLARVTGADAAKGRYAVALGPRLVPQSTSAASLVASSRADADLAARLAARGPDETAPAEPNLGLARGAVLEGLVAMEARDYGVICEHPDHEDLLFMIPSACLPPAAKGKGWGKGKADNLTPGVAVGPVVVLDADGSASGVIEVAGTEAVVAAARSTAAPGTGDAVGARGSKRSKRARGDIATAASVSLAPPSAGERLDVRIFCAKPEQGFCVGAVEGESAHAGRLCLVAAADLNSTGLPAGGTGGPFDAVAEAGALVTCVVADQKAVDSPAVMIVVPEAQGGASTAGAKEGASSRATSGGKLPLTATATVVVVRPMHVDVTLSEPSGEDARLHVTEILDKVHDGRLPLSGIAVGATLPVAIVGRSHGTIDVSARPSALAVAEQGKRAGFRYPSLASLKPGDVVEGCVAGAVTPLGSGSGQVGGGHLWVAVSPRLRGRVHRLDVGASSAALASFPDAFPLGTPVRARVLESTTSDGADAGGIGGASGALDLTLTEGPSCTGPLAVGALVSGVVTAVDVGRHALVRLGPGRSGRVAPGDVDDAWSDAPLARLRVGDCVMARVMELDETGLRAELSLRQRDGGEWARPAAAATLGGSNNGKKGKRNDGTGSGPARRRPRPDKDGRVPRSIPLTALTEGAEVKGWIRSVDAKGAFVTLPGGAGCRIRLAHLADGFVDDPSNAFPVGKLVTARVLRRSADNPPRVDLDLRTPGLARGGADGGPGRGTVDPSARSLDQLETDETIWGVVQRVQAYGAFVLLDGTQCSGLLHISECGKGRDTFIKDVASEFPPGTRLMCRVKGIDLERRRLSLALVPKGDEAIGDGGKGAGGRDDEDAIADDADAGGDDDPSGSGSGSGSESGSGSDSGDIDEDSGPDSGDDSDMSEGKLAAVPGSGLHGGDGGGSLLDGGSDDNSDHGSSDGRSASSEEDEAMDVDFEDVGLEDDVAAAAIGPGHGGYATVSDKAGKSTRAGAVAVTEKPRSKRERLEAEEEARDRERRRADGAAPASAAEFEAAVMAAPGEAYAWVRYMAWLMAEGDPDGARAVARRALSTIPMAAESEKFSVWVALINLEAEVEGCAAAMRQFAEAMPYCEPLKLHLAALDAVEPRALAGAGSASAEADVGRAAEAVSAVEELLKRMTRKHGREEVEPWLRKVRWHLRRGETSAARAAVEAATRAVPKRSRVALAVQTALLEFRDGSAERGRSALEGLIGLYPKRTDLWAVYLDQEAKECARLVTEARGKVGGGGAEDSAAVRRAVARARALFDRATSLTLPANKMKHLFKKSLAFEMRCGDAAGAAAVRAKALAFVSG